MIKAVIIDDEKKARVLLEALLSDFMEDVEVVGQAANAAEGKLIIEENQPDIVFLDVEMPNSTGFDMLSSFDHIDFDVVFITAYSEYALRAIKYSALDYLLKPVQLNDLKAAIDKYRTRSRLHRQDHLHILLSGFQFEKQNAKIALPVANGLKVVALADIVSCHAAGSYTELFIDNDKKIVVSKSLKHLEEKFSGFGFYRTHDSHLINLQHVAEYIRGRGGVVRLRNGAEIEVSRSKKSGLLKALKVIG